MLREGWRTSLVTLSRHPELGHRKYRVRVPNLCDRAVPLYSSSPPLRFSLTGTYLLHYDSVDFNIAESTKVVSCPLRAQAFLPRCFFRSKPCRSLRNSKS